MYDERQCILLLTRKQIKIFYKNKICGRFWKEINHSLQNNSFHLAHWEGDIRFPKIFLNTSRQKDKFMSSYKMVDVNTAVKNGWGNIMTTGILKLPSPSKQDTSKNEI